MDKNEIRSMFLLAAQLRHTPDTDPRKDAGLGILDRMTRRYAEEIMDPDGPAAGPSAPDWQQALEYVGSLFGYMDENDDDPVQRGLRAGFWNVISDAVSNFYQNPLCEELRNKVIAARANPSGNEK